MSKPTRQQRKWVENRFSEVQAKGANAFIWNALMAQAQEMSAAELKERLIDMEIENAT